MMSPIREAFQYRKELYVHMYQQVISYILATAVNIDKWDESDGGIQI